MDNYKNQAVMLYYQIWEAICPLQWNFHLTWDFDSDFEVAKIRAQMPLCLLDIQFSSWFGRFVMGTLMNWQSSWPSFLGFHSQQCQWPRETPNHDLLIEAKTSLKVNTFWATTQWPRALSKSPLPNISKCIHPKKPLNYGVGIRFILTCMSDQILRYRSPWQFISEINLFKNECILLYNLTMWNNTETKNQNHSANRLKTNMHMHGQQLINKIVGVYNWAKLNKIKRNCGIYKWIQSNEIVGM